MSFRSRLRCLQFGAAKRCRSDDRLECRGGAGHGGCPTRRPPLSTATLSKLRRSAACAARSLSSRHRRRSGEARLDLERDLRFGWDMWAWARLQAANRKAPSTTTRFNSSLRFRPARCMRAGARATSPNSVCLRPPGPVAVEMDPGRSKLGRRDVQLLGQLRQVGRS